MKFEGIACWVRLAAGALLCAFVAGCASPPPAPPTMSRVERVGLALKAMKFEQRDDGWHLSLPAPLIFPFDSDIVTVGARDNLMSVARELRELGIDQVVVRGHTDNVGTREYNLSLSKRRADAVAKVLVEGSYPAEKIDAKGLGSTVPIADNNTADGRQQNRRVVIIVQVV
jgi:outer membrane protein OmpA-like peptidoglycan-associated protein